MNLPCNRVDGEDTTMVISWDCCCCGLLHYWLPLFQQGTHWRLMHGNRLFEQLRLHFSNKTLDIIVQARYTVWGLESTRKTNKCMLLLVTSSYYKQLARQRILAREYFESRLLSMGPNCMFAAVQQHQVSFLLWYNKQNFSYNQSLNGPRVPIQVQ